MDNNWKVSLGVLIDQSSLSNAEKQLLKRKINIPIGVDSKSTQKLATDLQKITKVNTIQTWANNNTKAMRRYGSAIDEMIRKLNSADDLTVPQLKNIETEFKRIQAQARSTGSLGLTAGDKLSKAWSKFGGWVTASGTFMMAYNQLRKMPIAVKELDTELVDLRKTTNATNAELETFYFDSNKTAKQLGTTTKGIISQASEWSRLGYSIREAKKMAENSAILDAISPDLDIEKSTDGLVSTLKAFKLDADDSLDGIISKINVIGNTQAVSNGDIVDILTRSSSAMAAANNTLEQTIALGTAATEITRDADSVGTALKTISMRIRGYDEETESYSEDLESLTGDIADLTKTASTPGGISLFTDESKQTYKSTYEILKEISGIWDKLSDKNRAQLLEALAGKRQGQIVSAMLSNFGAAEKSMSSMAGSAGNAMQEMNVIYDSLDYKLNRLKETGVGIAQNLFGRSEMKNIIDGFTSIAEAIDFVTEKIGLLSTAGVALGAGLATKNVGRAKGCSF